MPGLVWVDALSLAPHQWTALLTSMALILRYGIGWRVLLLVHGALVTAFWDTPITTDTRLLFQSAQYLRQYTWTQFLSEFAFRDYVKLQPPLYTFWLSRMPVMWAHQIVQAGVAFGSVLLMQGMCPQKERVRHIAATPVFLLMSTQPGNDFLLFMALLCVLRLCQLRKPAEAAVLYGLCFLIKPLMLITMPFMLPKLRGWLLGTLIIIAGYYVWSSRHHFGVVQWGFLWRQLLLHKFFGPYAGAGGI